MTFSTNTAKRRPSARARSDESGYVIAQTALLLVPLLIFAAFATDIGAWYVQSQKIQRAADASALAGVAMMPDLAQAEQVARETALLNGYADATPSNNNDFDSGPAPQIRVTAPNSYSLEVEIRSSEDVYFSKLVMDDITLTRYGISEYVRPVYMGNPTSGLGTGTIDPAVLGQPNDKMWLSVNAYCTDHEHGDQFLSGYFDGTTSQGLRVCGRRPNTTSANALPNPTFDSDAYAFAVQYAPSSPAVDIDIFDPGIGCPGSITNDGRFGPGTPLFYQVFGPSLTVDHEGFMATNAPITQGSFSTNACSANGWLPIPGAQALATPGVNGGYYYVRLSNRNPNNDPGGSYWGDSGLNNFAMRVTRTGQTTLCTFSTLDPTCPQLYALEHLPLYRDLGGQSAFYLARIDETHAGERLLITFFDAAEGVQNLQFADSNDNAMPFNWKYSDVSVGKMPTGGSYPYAETAFAPPGTTCNWNGVGGNVCLNTSFRPAFNDRFVQIEIDIPDDYTCGADCWWRVRYTTSGSGTDRSGWSLRLLGDPVRLIE